jgi:hypothetical protein
VSGARFIDICKLTDVFEGAYLILGLIVVLPLVLTSVVRVLDG